MNRRELLKGVLAAPVAGVASKVSGQISIDQANETFKSVLANPIGKLYPAANPVGAFIETNKSSFIAQAFEHAIRQYRKKAKASYYYRRGALQICFFCGEIDMEWNITELDWPIEGQLCKDCIPAVAKEFNLFYLAKLYAKLHNHEIEDDGYKSWQERAWVYGTDIWIKQDGYHGATCEYPLCEEHRKEEDDEDDIESSGSGQGSGDPYRGFAVRGQTVVGIGRN